jgi:protease-4
MKDSLLHRNIKAIMSSMGSTPLAMDKKLAAQLALKYAAFVENAVLSNSVEREIERQKVANSVKYYNSESNVITGNFLEDFQNTQKGSIALIPVFGAMMRDSYCSMSDGWVSGTRELEDTIRSLDSNDAIDSVVFYINTPGGQSSGCESLNKVLKGMKKPKLGLFELMASAGVHAFSALDEVYALETQSGWGSIGQYISFLDDREYLKSMGLDIITIYAPQSTEKNAEYRAALDGDNEKMEESLKVSTAAFIKDVKKSLPNLKDDNHVFKGKMYNAKEALELGAIDGIKDLNFVLKRASKLAKERKKGNKKSELITSNHIEMSAEEKQKVSLWDKVFGDKNLKEAQSDLESIKADLDNSKQAYSDLEKASKEAIQKLEAANKELTESNATLAAESEAQKANLEALKGSEFETVADLLKDYETVKAHNVELGGAGSAALPVDKQQNHAPTEKLEKTLTTKQQLAKIRAEVDAETEEK